MSTTATPPLPLLAIAVVGAGGVGSIFAYHLARAGHDVTCVARPGSPRLLQLQRDEGIVLESGERAETRVADRLDEERAFDLVIVTTPSQQIASVLSALGRSQARAVHFMVNLLAAEKLAAAVGKERCTFGMPFVMARLDGDGTLEATVSASRKSLHSDQRWVTLFAQAGIPSEFEPRMGLWLRCHVPMCIGMESIAYKARQRGGGASWAEALEVARGMRGGFALVKAVSGELYPGLKRGMSRTPAPVLAGVLWGLSRNTGFRELLATGVRECRSLTDALVAEAEVKGVLPAAVLSVAKMRP